MTPEHQRIEIAMACGWKAPDDCTRTPSHKWQSPLDGCCYDELPDYANDLNAMHEAEKTMTDEQTYRHFVGYLVTVIKPGEFSVRATARQRAEAFLKVIGKWKP